MANIVSSYFNLIIKVEQLSFTTELFISTNNIILFPLLSMLIYMGFSQVDGWLLNIMKLLLTVNGSIYCLRGYFLLALLSLVDTKSKKK